MHCRRINARPKFYVFFTYNTFSIGLAMSAHYLYSFSNLRATSESILKWIGLLSNLKLRTWVWLFFRNFSFHASVNIIVNRKIKISHEKADGFKFYYIGQSTSG